MTADSLFLHSLFHHAHIVDEEFASKEGARRTLQFQCHKRGGGSGTERPADFTPWSGPQDLIGSGERLSRIGVADHKGNAMCTLQFFGLIGEGQGIDGAGFHRYELKNARSTAGAGIERDGQAMLALEGIFGGSFHRNFVQRGDSPVKSTIENLLFKSRVDHQIAVLRKIGADFRADDRQLAPDANCVRATMLLQQRIQVLEAYSGWECFMQSDDM